MLTFADRVKETATVNGTGVYTMTGALPGYRSFVSALGNNTYCSYCAESGNRFEVGEGTIMNGTLTRDRLHASSNSNNLVVWSAETVTLFCVVPAVALQTGLNNSVLLRKNGTLSVAPGTERWYPPKTTRFGTVEAWCGTQPVGSYVLFDLKKCGTTVFTGQLFPGARTPVSCALGYDTIANAKGDMDGDNIFDGIEVFVDMRVLLVGLINGQSNVYIVSGSPGNWTLTQEAITPAQDHTVYTLGGNTYSGVEWWFDGGVWNTLGNETSKTRLMPTAIDLSIRVKEWFTIDVTAIGTTTPGSDLVVRLT